MIINAATLSALRVGFKKNFQDGFSEITPEWDKIAELVTSSSKSEAYGWLNDYPDMREWIGDRVVKDMMENAYVIENKPFESTVGVKRTDVEDNTLGGTAIRMTGLGRAAARKPDQLVFGALAAGFSTLCFDGQNFFDSDHPVYANHDGTGTESTVSNIQLEYSGSVVSPGDANYSSGAIATGEEWFLLDTTQLIKPLIFQERKKPQFVAMVSETDENVFTRAEYRYGADMRGNAGYAFWQLAYASRSELNYENVWAARQEMMNFKADGGRPLGVSPNLLIVKPGNFKKASQLLKKEFINSGESNDLYGEFELLRAKYL